MDLPPSSHHVEGLPEKLCNFKVATLGMTEPQEKEPRFQVVAMSPFLSEFLGDSICFKLPHF